MSQFNYIDDNQIGRLIGKRINNEASGFAQGVDIPKKVVIPYEINNILVKGISVAAFYRCLNIEEVVIEARIVIIEAGSFFGCQNLRKINIPSSCETLSDSAIDGRIESDNDRGPLSIYFEPNSKIKEFTNAAISNFEKVNIFVYDKVYPCQADFSFYGITKMKIFSTYSYMFCGRKTTTIHASCIKNRRCSTLSSSILFYIAFVS